MKNVLILGAGISGLGAAHVLLRQGCHVIISDLHDDGHREEDKKDLQSKGVIFHFGPQSAELLRDIDTVIVSPVIPAENPVVQAARAKNIPVLSEVELAYKVAKAPILAVTGTNGKTTTTLLLGSMISNSAIPCTVAGNLGISLSLKTEDAPQNGLIAAEISSFQLEFTSKFHPHGAVILNITPDHLERHHTMEAYVQCKAKIFANMDDHDFLLLNANDPYTPQLKNSAETHTHVFLMSTTSPVEEGAYLQNDTLMIRYHGKEIVLCSVHDLKVRGKQNYEDFLAASFLAFAAGVPLEAIRKALKDFHSLPHRIEFVRKLHGVSYYNDSKATNVDASVKGMEAFDREVILIAGGHDKETPLEDFMKIVKKHVKHLILLGEAKKRFNIAAKKAGVGSIELADSMKDAVIKAQKFAKEGDIVLLSPACSSFDMYSCYQERGNDFKNIVSSLQ